MNRYRLAFIVAAIALIALWLYGPRDYRGLQSLLKVAPEQTTPGPITPEPTLETPAPDPAPETQPTEPADKCLDGSALTVTSRDHNQTNYRCASGAIGARTNRQADRMP